MHAMPAGEQHLGTRDNTMKPVHTEPATRTDPDICTSLTCCLAMGVYLPSGPSSVGCVCQKFNTPFQLIRCLAVVVSVSPPNIHRGCGDISVWWRVRDGPILSRLKKLPSAVLPSPEPPSPLRIAPADALGFIFRFASVSPDGLTPRPPQHTSASWIHQRG